jgi:hypothetical protein
MIILNVELRIKTRIILDVRNNILFDYYVK